MLPISRSLSTNTTGFNGGSALSADLRAAQACIVTNLAASVGGLTWMIWVRTVVMVLRPPAPLSVPNSKFASVLYKHH